MIKCQNSIVTANVRCVHHQLQATTPASIALFEKSFTALSIGPRGRLSQILKRFFEFGACFQHCFKPAVSLQHCAPYVIVHWVYIRRIWWPLVFCNDIWTAGTQPVLCAARRCALCVLTRPVRRPAGR